MSDDNSTKTKQLRDPYHNDVDYWSKLSAKDQEWLKKFQSTLKRGTKRRKNSPKVPDRSQRQLNQERYKSRQDIFTKGKRTSIDESLLQDTYDQTDQLIEDLDDQKDLAQFIEDLEKLLEDK